MTLPRKSHMLRPAWILCAGIAIALTMTVPASARTTPTATTPASTSRSPVVPVVSCDTTFGVTGQSAPWHPESLPVSLPTATAKKLNFYSNGFFTVLAPKGWACEGIVAANGSSSLSVHPATPQGSTGAGASASAQSVTITNDYTGHGPGAALVCAYFPSSPAARDASPCPALPAGTNVELLTADIAEAREPSGADTIVVYPQIGSDDSVNVTLARCALASSQRSLCASVLSDVLAREFPSTPAA